jgi:hypothetical protein
VLESTRRTIQNITLLRPTAFWLWGCPWRGLLALMHILYTLQSPSGVESTWRLWITDCAANRVRQTPNTSAKWRLVGHPARLDTLMWVARTSQHTGIEAAARWPRFGKRRAEGWRGAGRVAHMQATRPKRC